MSKRKNVTTPIVTGEGKDQKTFWQNVGSAFENKDGSLTILLNALPVNGKLVVFEEKEEKRS